ncbi:MAG TPA: hypothetical protein ENG70_05775 [Candidatus Cloacimonetes bacterium]|nr:hypothetical protein [Candidatus Cloacimonadota bacterium]HEX38341.1 hypothetical protein [Candidatus Cloacimonadota bacterium]
MKKVSFVIITILLLSSLCSAEITSNVFGNYIPSARARGMSGAFIASCDDPNAIFFNPGALAVASQGINLGYSRLFNNEFEVLMNGALTYKLPGKFGTVALGIQAMDVEYGGIKLQQEGTYSIAHSFLLMGDVHSQFYIGYGLNLYYLKFGETVGGIDPGNQTSYGINIGALATLHQRTHVAFSVRNVNNPTMGSDQTFDLPQYLALGVSYEPYDGVITEIDLSQKLGEQTKILAGIEFEIIDNFWLRTGASTYPNSISGGFGVLFKGVKVDYGFNTHPVMPLTHQFSLGYLF